MNLLAVDTSTDLCSCALWSNQQVSDKIIEASRQHATKLIPMIDALLKENDLSVNELDGLVFGRGPGSFTGVRICTAAVQGIALVADVPLVGVSTLQAMAFQAKKDFGLTRTVAALDARMKQVYCACYTSAGNELPFLIDHEAVLDPDQVQLPQDSLHRSEDWVAVGGGAHAYRQVFIDNGITVLPEAEQVTPLASAMVQLAIPHFKAGDVVDAANALPVYLRNKVALTEAERSQARESSSDS